MCACGMAWLACVLLGTVQAAGIDPAQLLDKMEQAHSFQREYTTRVECSVEATNPPVGDEPTPNPVRTQNVLELRYDGTRLDLNKVERIDLLTYPPLSDARDANNVVKQDVSKFQRTIWDGSCLFSSLEYQDANMTTLVNKYIGIAKDIPRPRKLLAMNYGASGLEGYVYGDDLSLMETLKEQDWLGVRKQMEEVQGALCYVLEASGLHGRYTVWVNPARGYNVAKVSVRKTTGHWYLGAVLGKPQSKRERLRIAEYYFDMNDVRCEPVNGVWIPMEATWTTVTKYVNVDPVTAVKSHSSGSLSSVRRFHARRLSIEVKPNFAAVRAFVPIIPDGTEIGVWGDMGIPYVWRRGEYVPDVNQTVVARIDKLIEKVKAAAAASEVTVFTEDSSQSNDTGYEKKWNSPNPCGIYSVYSASRFLGKPIEMASLFKPDYLGSPKGSTLHELATAVKDMGLYTEPLVRMDRSMLERCSGPVILHTKSERGQYGHWILCLAARGGKVLMFDPPKAPKWISPGELAARWAGLGLIISDKPIEKRAIVGPSLAYLGGGIALIAVVLLALRTVAPRWPASLFGFRLGPWRKSWIQTAAVLVIAGTVSLAYGGLRQEGLLAGAGGTRYIQEVQRARFIPKVGVRDVETMTAAGAAVIDARLATDFPMGHIQGAINIPVDANDAICQARSADIPKSKKIILYCQSSKCQFAEKIAKWLMDRGYSDVAIFRGGWTEWRKHHPEMTKERSV